MSHNRYRFADLVIESEIPLPELPQLTEVGRLPVPDLVVATLRSPIDHDSLTGRHDWSADGERIAITHARSPTGYVLLFRELADFEISSDGAAIGIWRHDGSNDETTRHLLLDQLLPRVLGHRGKLVTHGASVLTDAGAVCFLGETGGGKSTLTASFVAAGSAAITDDGFVSIVEDRRVLALATYPSLRLWPDSLVQAFDVLPAVAGMAHYSAKLRVLLGDEAFGVCQFAPLDAMFVLEPALSLDDESIELIPLSARDTCMAIIKHSFVLDPTDAQRAAAMLSSAGAVAEYLPAYSLRYPREYAQLPAVQATILRQLAAVRTDRSRRDSRLRSVG